MLASLLCLLYYYSPLSLRKADCAVAATLRSGVGRANKLPRKDFFNTAVHPSDRQVDLLLYSQIDKITNCSAELRSKGRSIAQALGRSVRGEIQASGSTRKD